MLNKFDRFVIIRSFVLLNIKCYVHNYMCRCSCNYSINVFTKRRSFFLDIFPYLETLCVSYDGSIIFK